MVEYRKRILQWLERCLGGDVHHIQYHAKGNEIYVYSNAGGVSWYVVEFKVVALYLRSLPVCLN